MESIENIEHGRVVQCLNNDYPYKYLKTMLHNFAPLPQDFTLAMLLL